MILLIFMDVGGDCGKKEKCSKLYFSADIVQVLSLDILSLVVFLKLVSCTGGLVVFTGRGWA